MMGKSLVSIFVWNPLMIVKLSSFVFDDTNIFVKINFLKHNSHIIIYIYKYAWTFHMLNEASESVCSHHFNLDPSHVRNEKCFRRSGKRFGTREPSCNVRFLCGGCFFGVQKGGDFKLGIRSEKNEAFSKSGKSHRNFAEITSSHQFGS